MFRNKITNYNFFADLILIMAVFGLFGFIGIDVLAGNDKTQIKGEYRLERLDEQADFGMSDDVVMNFKFSKDKKVFADFAQWFKFLFVDEYKNLNIQIKVLDAKGDRAKEIKPEVKYLGDGEFDIAVDESSIKKPGKYSVLISFNDSDLTAGETINFEQDFSWGVLAFNTNKSIFLPTETAYLQMAVLDEMGHTLCGADLYLEITAPDGGTAFLNTDNGLIIRNPRCGPDNIIHSPDYFAYYGLAGAGEYLVKLTARSANGEYSIIDKFEVRESLPFEIERVGPTRINPVADYNMVLRIKANEDFVGNIIERIPSDFKITNYKLQITNNIQYPISNIQNNSNGTITLNDFKLEAGQEVEFSYSFDAPDISPEFYLFGEARLEETKFLQSDPDRRNLVSFSEARQWQIASDATTSITFKFATSGSSVNWDNLSGTDPSYAWDKTQGTYAGRDIPKKTGGGEPDNYLQAEANDSYDLGNTIEKVEIGFESYCEDTGYVDVYLLPVFDGQAGSTKMFGGTDLGTTDNNTIHWYDVTGVGYAPTTWYWSHVMSLDARVYGVNSHNGQSRWIRVDQFYVRVTYQLNNAPSGSIDSAQFRSDGSGVVDLSINVSDPENDDSRARIDYVLGADCNFNDATSTLDETDATATSTSGTDPKIENDNYYQIGNASGWIDTSAANTVYFDWLSQSDIPNASSTYCVRLRVNDQLVDQTTEATTTIYIDNYPPQISDVNFEPSSGWLKIGDTATATIYADNTDYASGTITINGVDAADTLVDNGDNTYSLTYTVAEGDDYIGLEDNLPVSIALKDSYNNSSAAYTTADAAGRPGVDGDIPVISSASVVNDAYKIGDTIDVSVSADEAGYTLGTTTVNSVLMEAGNFTDNGGGSYTISYTVSESDTDQGSGNIPVSIILIDAAGNVSGALESLDINVASIDAHAPAISGLSISNTAMKVGDNVTVTFTVGDDNGDEYSLATGTINGFPLAGFTRFDSTTYTAEFTVVEGGNDAAAGSDITVSNIVIEDTAGNQSGAYNTPISQDSDPIDANTPEFDAVIFSPDAEVLKIGDTATITITILAAETSLASGSTMTVNGIDVRDTFVDINGSSAQVTYTVEEGHDDKDDTDNLPVVFYIKDGAGNESLIYNDVDVNGRPGVDGHAPTILNITIPNIAMKVGGTVIATTTVGDDGGESYSLATGTIGGFSLFNFNRVDNTTYTMEFTIAEGGNDVPAGSDIPVDNVIIQDVVANESSAYNTPISQAGDLLDANTPLISDVVFNITEGILKIGDTATATISSDGTGYSGGTIEINSIDVSGTLAAGAGNNYTVTYTVEEGHTDIPDSSDLPISLSLVDTAGNESAAYETQATTSRPGVDAHAPAISGLSIPNTAMKVGDNVTVTFTVGDDNGDEYSLATGTINGFPLAGFTRFDSTTYTAEFTVVEGGNDAAAGSDITVSNIVIEDTAGNQSGAYNTPISQAGDPIDANTPSQPGPLSLYQKYSASLVLNLGATTTEANFSEYKIFYKQGSSGVTESDSEWSQSNDGNFDNILFYGATTTTITGLATGTEYVFNIWVYDSAGNKASSTSEFSTYTNYDPGSAGGLFQYRSDAATPILNTGWINEDNVILQANVNDDDTDEVLTLYFEAATSTDSFSGDVSSPCDEASGWDSCAGKVWATSSSAGDYSSSPFTGQVHLSALPNSATGIKWRVMACDDSGAYSAWVDAGADPNFKVDHQAPAAPGNLAPIDRSAVSVTFELTGTTTESNFNEYRIYYKAGSSGVTEDDFLFASTSDPNLADINFLSATTTTVDSLSAGTEYVFNIWAYDLAGNSAHAVEVSTTTSLAAQPPTGIFDSATQKTDGSGAIDVSIIADDPDNDNTLRARLDYVLGVTCDFGDPLDPYIDTENVSDSHASAPDIDNTYEYQVGTSTGWIITAPGANTVSFDWLSKLNIPEADGDYCLQLRVNDGSYSQVSPATTSIYIDNAAPDPPGDLQYEAKDIDSITLSFGATSSDSNFSHYKIFYKAGSSGVAENDSEHVDGDLNSFNYGGTATTAISNLAPGTEYVINIWAYDDYGNKASATEMTATINYLPEVPVALTQKLSDGATDISNGIWITQDSVNLTARANDSDTSEVITMYFELLPANDTLKTATTAPFSACPAETDWDSCDSKVWHATSSEGDYSASPFIATVTPSALPDSETGYMWQVMVCDDNDACSEWTIFNLDQPNFKADSHAPSEPGPLSVVDFDAASVTLDLGATSTEDYFYQYIIYYSESSPVTEAGYEHSSSTDINLFAQDFDTATSTEIEGLDPGTLYNFNIWAYDKAGNAASSSFETATTTNNYPAADFVSASQKRDGSGAVDISIQVDDADDDDEIRAKIDYVLGEACDFASASDPTLKELDASATSTYGDAKVENDNTYQIGNSLGWILTSSGQNTVNFDWLSQGDIPYASSTYCLRLTINDGRDNQEASATTTLEIDNYAPSTPGNLEFYSHSSSTIILAYGDATTEDHFSEYRIFYLQGAATADENDTEHNDSNLDHINYFGAATTTVEELDTYSQYNFRVYAYDAYGNKSYSDSVMFQTNNPPTVTINSAGQRTDGSGIIDIEIEVYDDNADDCQAKVEYKAGSDCDFSTSGDDPTLDETPANITSDKGTKPEIDNASVYQIGTSTRIITSGGANTVTFDWLSQIDIGDLDNTYCLQVTANDGSDINLTPATTTLIIDNLAPTAPGSLTATSVGGLSITLELGATTTENHFSEYEIYYKADALSGVTENDNQFTQYDDNNLSNKLFYGAESVEIDSLSQNTDYVFNIWVYDTYGNTASAAAEAATTTVEVPAATWREEEDTPDPTAGTPIGKETPVRLRAAVANAGDWTVNYALGLQYGMKNGSCAGISEWTAVPRTADGEHFEMIDSDYFNNMEPTSEKLSSSTYAFLPGFMIELPSATSSPLNLDGGDYSELEYVFQATATSTAGTAYCFRLTYNGLPIDNYDYYPELSLVPKPVGEFVDARQKNNGSGVVDIEIDVKDYDGDLSRARLDYAVGAECNFASPLDPTLDENSANISADYGLPIINNASTYQIGTSTGKIITQYGTNTVAFDWDSKSDANNAEDTYCLRLTVNDYFDDQDPAATTTITVDNLNPTTPGDLSIVSKTTNSVTLDLATASSDNHFFEYRIYYKEGSSGVSESNDLHSSSTDENLGFADFLGATTTTVYGLEENKQYVFKIWAYDEYGNSTSSVNEVNTKLVPSYFGTVYSDDGQTSLLTEPKVSMIVDGVFEKSVYASADDGSFEFVDVAPPATGTPVLIFLDDADEKGAAYNRYGGQGEINDFDIYQNHVIMRHDDDGPIATANVDAYDSDQDEDIICAVSGIDFNMASGYILYVWPGSTFEAGSGSMSFENIEIKGSFEAVGEQTITVSGGWDASSGSFDAASSTVEFTSTFAGNRIIANNNPFWSLTLNGAGGQWLFSGSATTSATTTIQAGILLHGADNHFEIGSLVIYDGASYQKATGTGKLIFEGRGFGIFEDNNSAPTNLGNVQIGYSPGRTNLNSDFAADSLTINASDSFYTRGYEVDITNDITIYGTYDCTDNKELDGTITTLGGDWLLDASAVFIADTSTTTFDGASDSSLSPGGTDASHDFNHLSLEKASTATTTINGGNLIIGGDLNIGANSIFDASSTNYDIYTSGGWTNQGKFIARQATTTFDAASAGHSIDAGDSAFYNLVFNSGSGGWTIAANATTSNNLAIASANSFIAASGTRIEVYGQFYNAVGAGNTTWNGSVLYLESGSEYAINAKNSGDLYGTLAVGPDTDINMWDSSANWYEIDNTGSLYSMDHGDNAGRLNIYGDYYVKEGESAYWSYATDFDGIDLSGSPRLCQVEIADGATTTVAEAGTLNILGSSAASTTISNQGSGNYALRVASGTLEADYFQIRNTNASGLNIYGSTTVDSLDHGDFELGVEGGSMITLTAGVININPYATSTGCRFATSTGISSGYNVALIGVPTDDWEFTGHYGNYDGDDFDNDPGDPRGYILWDDSIEYSPKSQAWQWFYDIEDKTPTSTPAAAATSSPSIGPGNTLKLRLTIAETGGLIGENSKMRLQYSTQPDFSSDAYWVGEIGSSTALWTYADGSQDYDNEVISQLILPDSSVVATHNESGISTTTYDHTADTAAEWEFTVFNNKAEDGVVYYFRAYSIYYFSIVNIYEKAVLPNTDESYPSLVVSSAALSMTISGVSDKTSIGEIETDFGTTATSVPFGELNPLSTVKEGAQRFTISTNAENGYQLFVYQRQNLVSESGAGINPISCTNEDPSSWSLSGNSGFGYHTTDVNLSNIGAGPSRFAPDNSYAKLEANIKEIGYSSIPVASDTFDLIYKLEITDLQAAGNYETDIVYILVPTF